MAKYLASAATTTEVAATTSAGEPAVLDALFHALADPTRRAVLRRLGAGPASVGELAEPFEMALPSFLKHIRALEESGCIRTAKHGRVRMCTLEKKAFTAAESWLASQRELWEGRTDRLEAFVTGDGAKKEEESS